MVAFGTTSKNDGIRPAPYQLVPLTKLLLNGLDSVLIADGVGVGKTISASYIACYIGNIEKKAGLVLCPPSLISKWMEELRSKFSLPVFPIRSQEDLLTAKEESVHISEGRVPIYVMSNSVMTLAKIDNYPSVSSVIFDEVHTYRNRATRWFSSAVEISKLAKFRVGLTATPINNSIEDLVSELNILLPEFAWDALRATIEELWAQKREQITIPLVTRFTKDKLGLHFAQRRVLSNIVSYPTHYVNEVRQTVSRMGPTSSIYEKITYFRIAASSPFAFRKHLRIEGEPVRPDPKLNVLLRILDTHKLSHWLIFCEFEETVNYLEKSLNEWNTFKLTGDTPMFDRSGIINVFRSTPKSVLIMTSVGAEGLDLQFCQALINYDLHWNPMRLEQRIGRVDRIGQDKSEVFVFNIIVDGSIDERVVRVIKRKLSLIADSVFATGEILGKIPLKESPEPKRPDIFDQQSISHELDQTRDLVAALRYSEQLPSQDYGILADVQPEYCWPEILARAGAENPYVPKWLTKSDETLDWMQRVVQNASNSKNLMTYYT